MFTVGFVLSWKTPCLLTCALAYEYFEYYCQVRQVSLWGCYNHGAQLQWQTANDLRLVAKDEDLLEFTTIFGCSIYKQRWFVKRIQRQKTRQFKHVLSGNSVQWAIRLLSLRLWKNLNASSCFIGASGDRVLFNRITLMDDRREREREREGESRLKNDDGCIINARRRWRVSGCFVKSSAAQCLRLSSWSRLSHTALLVCA